MDLYSDNYSSYEEEKLPTLTAYLKKVGKGNKPKKFLVTKIWRPNRYPSYGIETEHFRTTISQKSPLGTIISQNWSALVESEVQTMVSLEMREGKCVGLKFSPGRGKGTWYDIGDNPLLGIRWEGV